MEILGGIGLFLLGMMMLSHGLQGLASDALSRILESMTQTKLRGLFVGVVITNILQSSSVAILLTLGFVNSGLITFQNSLGLIFGANLGTTFTAWFISLVGFNFSIKSFAVPMIGVGALMQLFKKKVVHNLGLGVAGFGLLFFGIDMLQSGMINYSQVIAFDKIAADGFFNKVILVIIGMLMSVIMQSSTAAVATTLTALHGGMIGFHEATLLVIGQNVGTTFKAILGAYGASIATKRTAAAHFFFNVVAAVVAFIILPFFWMGFEWIEASQYSVSNTLGLSFFHTFFSVLGVMICLPLSDQMSRFIERMIKSDEKESEANEIIRELSVSEITGPLVALEILAKNMGRIFTILTDLERAKEFRPYAMKVFDHCYNYISKITPDIFEERAVDGHIKLIRALENLRGIAILKIEDSQIEKLNQILPIQAIIDQMKALEKKMEYFLNNSAEAESYIEENIVREEEEKIILAIKNYRIQLLKKGQEKSLGHGHLTELLDTLKNLQAHHGQLIRTYHHLSPIIRPCSLNLEEQS